MPAEQFVAALGTVFEDAPWVAAAAAAHRPFATIDALHATMLAAVRAAQPAEIIHFLQGHPELSGAAARAGTIGADSTAEQAGLGLQRAAAETDRIAALNAAYRERFGFPFIICVRRHTASSLLRQFERRLSADFAAERETALTEIGYITRLRIVDRVDGPGAPVVHGWLSTHVLDTAKACPAANIPVELWEVGGTTPSLLASAVTNPDGRTDKPLLAGAPLRIGTYELRFHVGPYLSNPGPGFLDIVPVRFGITEPEAHYHVPLLVSPGGYTTYRGS
jgi:2-oxo-4-hydroxy-4-carboxy-5-ureidoimidazoline decarboxylase